MVRRHPHVFGDAVAKDANAVLVQWERIKASEKNNLASAKKSAMDKVSRSMPTLAPLRNCSARAAKVGFDWKDDGPVS